MRATWSPLGKGTGGGGRGHRVYTGLVTRQVVVGVPGFRPLRGGAWVGTFGGWSLSEAGLRDSLAACGPALE